MHLHISIYVHTEMIHKGTRVFVYVRCVPDIKDTHLWVHNVHINDLFQLLLQANQDQSRKKTAHTRQHEAKASRTGPNLRVRRKH